MEAGRLHDAAKAAARGGLGDSLHRSEAGIRVLGRFAAKNVFIALGAQHREVLGPPENPACELAMKQCATDWRNLFGPSRQPCLRGRLRVAPARVCPDPDDERLPGSPPPPQARPYDSNVYFSQAPLRTNDHVVLLREVADRTDGGGLPRFVEREFREFLTCGALRRGFAHVRCEGCAYERLVPFSCKRGGGAHGRRASEACAVHRLVRRTTLPCERASRTATGI